MIGPGERPASGEWTPKAVAQRLGVSAITLRTWERRYGLGPGDRQPGKHRRYTEEDVRRLRRMVELTGQGMAAAAAAATALAESDPAAGPVFPTTPELTTESAVRGLHAAALRMDAPALRHLTRTAIAEFGVIGAWERVCTPVLVELGQRVAESGSGVEIEHVISDSIEHVLRELTHLPEQGNLCALLSAAPDEHHTLPLDALAAALAGLRRSSRMLGARVPPAALLGAVRRLRPLVTVVWSHQPATALATPVRELTEDRRTVLVLAGPGWAEVEVPEHARRVQDLRGAVRFIDEAASRRWG
ncbi:MerR family transcriptional regulator [Crossiella sp. CA-258035]|uniref:MerR family transcriptional regulator n=1 Tax=Crossiella sp. CA-258035 TaxID=2981138 RepID=UPI0024BC9FF0|nr:MerR family transcriptional regulator [Crossiella sp. CA-258035]WHT16262.1 MerR family transcriptional regulator [Crossiella sp. CA-258035]